MARKARSSTRSKPREDEVEHVADVEEDELELEETGRAEATKRPADSADDGQRKRRMAGRKFSMYVKGATEQYAMDPNFVETDIAADVKEKERAKVDALAPEEVKKLVAKMTRYLLMRGSKRLPILKSKLNEAVMYDYKKTGITTFVLGEAQKMLRAIWGYDLVQAPKSLGNYEYKGNCKDAWYVAHKASLRSPERGELTTAGLSSIELAQRGFLMTVLALVQSSQPALKEKELFRHLSKLDGSIPEEPGTVKGTAYKVEGLGHVVQLLDGFKDMHYLVKDKDQEDNTIYRLGPRALVDVGRFQIIQFQADALGQSVDPAIIREIEEEDEEEESDEEDARAEQ